MGRSLLSLSCDEGGRPSLSPRPVFTPYGYGMEELHTALCELILRGVEDPLELLARPRSCAKLRSPLCRPCGIVAAPREVAMISTDSVGSFVFLAELLVRGQARHL